MALSVKDRQTDRLAREVAALTGETFVVEGRKGEAGRERLERFFQLTGTEIVSPTART